jgi:queuosine precursor transporter
MRILFYLLAIVLANVITAATVPLSLWVFIVPWGSFLIGATFILRDLVQQKYGRKTAYLTIITALFFSALTSSILGDPLTIVLASAISFLISETTDTEIYTRLKLPFYKRVFASGFVGGILDSAIFVIVGLSPLGAGFLPWNAVVMAILGQVIVKTIMQAIGSAILYKASR